MEAKDTVMSDGEITKLLLEYEIKNAKREISNLEFVICAAEAQAEISFKAGIREVVEWLINDSYDTTIHFGEDWQAKLKEWGVE